MSDEEEEENDQHFEVEDEEEENSLKHDMRQSIHQMDATRLSKETFILIVKMLMWC